MVILTSTVLSLDGTYTVATVDAPATLAGAVHYCGHPDTRALLEECGAVKSEANLFAGLQVGESFLACSLAKPRNGGASDHTTHQSVASPSDLVWRKVTRLA